LVEIFFFGSPLVFRWIGAFCGALYATFFFSVRRVPFLPSGAPTLLSIVLRGSFFQGPPQTVSCPKSRAFFPPDPTFDLFFCVIPRYAIPSFCLQVLRFSSSTKTPPLCRQPFFFFFSFDPNWCRSLKPGLQVQGQIPSSGGPFPVQTPISFFPPQYDRYFAFMTLSSVIFFTRKLHYPAAGGIAQKRRGHVSLFKSPEVFFFLPPFPNLAGWIPARFLATIPKAVTIFAGNDVVSSVFCFFFRLFVAVFADGRPLKTPLFRVTRFTAGLRCFTFHVQQPLFDSRCFFFLCGFVPLVRYTKAVFLSQFSLRALKRSFPSSALCRVFFQSWFLFLSVLFPSLPTLPCLQGTVPGGIGSPSHFLNGKHLSRHHVAFFPPQLFLPKNSLLFYLIIYKSMECPPPFLFVSPKNLHRLSDF